MRTFVAVAVHRPCSLPRDPLYTPVEVGAALRGEHFTLPDGSPMLRDDRSADNLSGRNPSWCELTAHYAMYRGVDAEVYGLCHYRRFFAGRRFGKKESRVLRSKQLDGLMRGVDVVLPKKRHYLLQTCYAQYTHAHHERDLEVTRSVLEEMGDPRYVAAFERTLKRRSGHRFNMFLMRKDAFERYSAWLFKVLLRVEERLDLSEYTASDSRVFGYLGERLMDVWVEAEKPCVRECPVVFLESQHWPKKIAAFLLRMVHPARR